MDTRREVQDQSASILPDSRPNIFCGRRLFLERVKPSKPDHSFQRRYGQDIPRTLGRPTGNKTELRFQIHKRLVHKDFRDNFRDWRHSSCLRFPLWSIVFWYVCQAIEIKNVGKND